MRDFIRTCDKFYYLMKLHYSQTILQVLYQQFSFYYLMKLHYSQTTSITASPKRSFTTLWNYTILKPIGYDIEEIHVLLPYEITLFSNKPFPAIHSTWVLLPYEITLFSNESILYEAENHVLLPYEITLFSNPLEFDANFSYVLLPYEITLFSNNNALR